MFTLPWWFVSLVANVAIISTENINRSQATLLGAWGKSWPFMLLAQVSLWYSFNRAPHWLAAWIVFTIGNNLLRLGTVAYSEPVSIGWAGLGSALMIGAAFCIKRATT